MHENNPLLSLIIAVYNKTDFLELVFASLGNQTFREFEVILADDGSGPAMADCIRGFQYLSPFPLRHVWHDDTGFRKTIIVNKAAVMASADYLAFIDGDCLLHRRYLERHWKCRGAGVVCTGRRVYFGKSLTGEVGREDVVSGRIERPSFWWRGAERYRFRGLYMPWLDTIKNSVRRRYFILGSNFSLHKADFLALNGYDERIIGRGLEDNNLHARALKAGMRIRYVAHQALQYHLYHTSDPIPHDSGTVAQFVNPAGSRTSYGIVKRGGDG